MYIFLFASIASAAMPSSSPESVTTPTMSVGVRDGVVTSFVDEQTKEAYAVEPAPSLTGLRRLKNQHLWNDTASVQTHRDRQALTVKATWREGRAESQLTTRLMPEPNGDILVTQQATSGRPGMFGVQWGLVVPDSWEVLVPSHSGQRFGAENAHEQRQFDYPMGWEAQFVLIQGTRGGLLIHAEDNAERFKSLHLEHQDGRYLIGFETRCTAPFEAITEASSVRWRIHAYQGQWLVGAGVYRAWATRAFGLKPVIDRKPAWVRDIQLVVITELDDKLLKTLARHVEPSQTLLYVPGWRRDGYDRNYPNYTAREGFEQQIKQAHALGFRVMLHVNYFGVTPENPHYEHLKPYHCVDPFTKKRLYWDWQRANPPIKFAYINPAAKAWRDLFVQLMVELCERLDPDALHLDQTVAIFNHAGGLIDGMNMMQGNIAIHRELRHALPEVALSGEGLNEITCRYEAFAQRHVYGINHVDQEWNELYISQAHPVSSSLLSPCTTMYGYLGMANPEPEDYYFAWRRAYEHFGVIPTFARPSMNQLTDPSPIVRALLAESRWFQQNRPLPDFRSQWAPGTLFAYRTGDAGQAVYRRDANGVALVALTPEENVIARRITGATSVRLPGTIPNWRAYDETRLIGMNPNHSYVYLDEPRETEAMHVRSLPQTTVVRRIGLRPDHAVLCFEDRRTVVANLWEWTGPVRAGETLRDNTTHQIQGPTFTSPTGTRVYPLNSGIFAHPPYQNGQIGVAWIECDVELPPDKPARFQSGIGLRGERAAENSDGVTFRVIVRKKGSPAEPITLKQHAKEAAPKPISLDLSSLRGQSVTIRLETHPGPAGSPAFDWALWTKPRIIITESYAEPIEVVSPRRILGQIPSDGQNVPQRRPDDRYTLTVPIPGTTYLLFKQPQRIDPPVDLWKLPIGNVLIQRDGREQAPYSFMKARTDTGVVGGITKPGFFAHPPPYGQMHIELLLALPSRPLRLTGFAGIRDGAEGKSQGVGFRVTVNGQQQWSRDVQPDGNWIPVDVSLAPFAGQAVVLTLITDALGAHTCDWAQWGQVRLVAER